MDPALARRRLRAIIDLYGGDGVDRHSGSSYLQMARNDLERLTTRSPQPNAAEVQFVEERVAEADRLDASDPAAARKVRSAVVELYVDKSWARDLVDRANRKLIPPGDSSAQR